MQRLFKKKIKLSKLQISLVVCNFYELMSLGPRISTGNLRMILSTLKRSYD